MNTQTYTVNIRTGVVNITRVDVSQGDTGRTLAFKLYDGLIPFTPPNGSTVTIVGRKPSGLGFSETCTVSGNTAAVNTTLAMTQEPGKFPVELRIESDTRSIGTANFVLSVEPSPHPAGTTDGTTEEARTVLAQCAQYAQEAQEAAESASGDYTEIRSDVDDLSANVDQLNESLGNLTPGLSRDARAALLTCFEHVAWIDEHGQTYYNALEDALYPDVGLVSITATFTQGSTVIYQTTPLNDLKAYLVVTGHYNNGTSNVITDYSLSGALTVGTSTVTVNVNGKTTTFTVTVSAPYWDYEWDATSGVAPSNYFGSYEHDFTKYPDAMYAYNFYFDFNHVGDVDILFVAKMAAEASVSTERTPQISVRGAQGSNGYDGFKIVFNTPSGKVETNLSGAFVSINIDYTDYHEYRVKYENGVGYLYVDGNLVAQGAGVTNNQYMYMTGIFASVMKDGRPDLSRPLSYSRMAIKSVKYKGLS